MRVLVEHMDGKMIFCQSEDVPEGHVAPAGSEVKGNELKRKA
jgi:hypothetical protein